MLGPLISLAGLYELPYAAQPGDVLTCELAGTVEVCGFSDGPIPWPHDRQGWPIIWGGLADALRHESAERVSVLFGLPLVDVERWQEQLGERCMTPVPRPGRFLKRQYNGTRPRWLPHHDDVLIRRKPKVAAAILGRTVGAISQRRNRLEIVKPRRDRKRKAKPGRESYLQ